jgi:tRNA threonylcarbamoyladenosine biosynthesis protein TsaB
MSLILNIDTSTENASICLADEGVCLFKAFNSSQKEHAAWLHPAIKYALNNTGIKIGDLKAVGITAGPGSYTGLRVAMATAKGLCFALNIPLIAVSTLYAMASVAVSEETDLICPMIDAKRMEVFTALYGKDLESIIAPCSLILDEKSFSDQLIEKRILFFGNGKNKFENINYKKNAIFKNLIFNASHLAAITYGKFVKSDFSSLQATEPIYLKEYYTLFIGKS